MFGQSARRSRSRRRRFVTKSLMSETGIGLTGCAVLVFVLSDKLRDRPVVVAVDDCDVVRDIL